MPEQQIQRNPQYNKKHNLKTNKNSTLFRAMDLYSREKPNSL